MSVKYYCDCCKQVIANKKDRVLVNTLIVEGDKKSAYHFHTSCWQQSLKRMLEDNFVQEDKPAVDSIIQTSLIEQAVSEQFRAIPENTESPAITLSVEPEKSVRVMTVDVDRDNWREFELTECKGITKYFTNEVCSKLHRFIMLESKPRPISNYFNIPYQTVVLYMRTYKGKYLDSYKPLVDTAELDKIKEEYCKQIPKIKALLATCTWPFADVASECVVPEEVVRTIWDELPYFIKDYNSEKDDIFEED